ncbi:MAG: hypothetical protein KGY41_02170, partial [Desulfovermiculus sp.]|nr:hypothetical protein [Desulfovermiculus sp.]
MDDQKDMPQARKRKPFIELLPWQWFVLFVLAGVYAIAHPVPGGLACVLLAGLMFLHRRLPLRLYWGIFAFCLGLAWTWLHAPHSAAPSMPEWMEQRTKVNVQAQVDAVRFRPENRIQILLSGVRCLGP